MNRVKTIILISVLATVFCLSFAVGSTYALYFGEDSKTIEVTSGSIAIKREVTRAVTYFDYGSGFDDEREWPSGGAGIYDGYANIESMVSGCKVSIHTIIRNSGTLEAKWRITITFEKDASSQNDGIFDFVEFAPSTAIGFQKKSSNEMISAWRHIGIPKGNVPDVSEGFDLDLTLPLSVQGYSFSGNIYIQIEAVCGNVPTTDFQTANAETNLSSSYVALGNLPIVCEGRKFDF